MYDEILCPTDGSGGSDAAVEHACYLAELADARIHALFVVDETIAGADGWDVVVEREEERGENALDAVAAAGAERGVPVERHLRRGRPHEEILDAAGEPKSAQELSDQLDVPFATCSRRIDELEDTELLELHDRPLSDEHRRIKVYRRCVVGVNVRFRDGLTVELEERSEVKNKLDDVWRTMTDG
jgi:hypothetical protein